jgi:hypothetical protein
MAGQKTGDFFIRGLASDGLPSQKLELDFRAYIRRGARGGEQKFVENMGEEFFRIEDRHGSQVVHRRNGLVLTFPNKGKIAS